MKENAMQIALILDRSGSMGVIAAATVEGVNAFLAEQKKTPAETAIRFVQFDDQFEEVYDGKIDQAPLLTLSDTPAAEQRRYQPRGWTRLLDAMGNTIDDLGKRLSAMPETDRPGKVVVVTMTDGHENDSQQYKRRQVAEMIARQRDVYKWEFLFLGANQDAIEEAAKYNIPAGNAINFAANAAGTRNVMRSTSRNLATYAVTGQSISLNYLAEDRTKAMEDDLRTVIKP